MQMQGNLIVIRKAVIIIINLTDHDDLPNNDQMWYVQLGFPPRLHVLRDLAEDLHKAPLNSGQEQALVRSQWFVIHCHAGYEYQRGPKGDGGPQAIVVTLSYAEMTRSAGNSRSRSFPSAVIDETGFIVTR